MDDEKVTFIRMTAHTRADKERSAVQHLTACLARMADSRDEERARAEKAEAALAAHRKLIWMPLSVRHGSQSPEEWYEAGERIKKRFQDEREEQRARAVVLQARVWRLEGALRTSKAAFSKVMDDICSVEVCDCAGRLALDDIDAALAPTEDSCWCGVGQVGDPSKWKHEPHCHRAPTAKEGTEP